MFLNYGVNRTVDNVDKKNKQVVFNHSCTSAYVTHEDIGRSRAFQEQTVIVVKAPEETKLEVPAPKEVNDHRQNSSQDDLVCSVLYPRRSTRMNVPCV